MKTKLSIIVITGLFFLSHSSLQAQAAPMAEPSDKLVVLWTSDDPYVAERVALMYTHAAKTQGWFKEVTLIVWGPSAKLASENIKIQEKLKAMQNDGVIIEACVACANAYGIADDLRKLGYDVKGMGKPLTDYLKSGAKVLVF